jgi:hypothetical protein
MSQYEQENDLGRGGGEVDDETQEQGWRNRERMSTSDDPAERREDIDEDVERRT